LLSPLLSLSGIARYSSVSASGVALAVSLQSATGKCPRRSHSIGTRELPPCLGSGHAGSSRYAGFLGACALTRPASAARRQKCLHSSLAPCRSQEGFFSRWPPLRGAQRKAALRAGSSANIVPARVPSPPLASLGDARTPPPLARRGSPVARLGGGGTPPARRGGVAGSEAFCSARKGVGLALRATVSVGAAVCLYDIFVATINGCRSNSTQTNERKRLESVDWILHRPARSLRECTLLRWTAAWTMAKSASLL